MLTNWKEIQGFEGLYAVSDCGKVKSLPRPKTRIKKELILKQGRNRDGYPIVNLKIGYKAFLKPVHRIVARAFHANSEFNNAVVNHIDGNKENNHFTNLEWVTVRQNVNHAVKMGLVLSGSQHHQYTNGDWVKGEYKKTCPICGKGFVAKFKVRIYCSKRCMGHVNCRKK